MIRIVFKPDMTGRRGEPAVSSDHYIEMNNWCKENCKGEWRDTHIWLVYEFELEDDALLFKLTWG